MTTFLAYYSSNGKTHTREIKSLSFWHGSRYEKGVEPTVEKIFFNLQKDLSPLEYISVKPSGEAIKTDNPLLIYSEIIADLITADGIILYSRYSDSPHANTIHQRLKENAIPE